MEVKLGAVDKESRVLVDRTKSLNDHLDKKSILVEKTDSKLDQTIRQVNMLQRDLGTLNVQITEIERNNDRNLD